MYDIRTDDDRVVTVHAKFVRLIEGSYFFYNKENTDDIDQPIAVYAQETIKEISKVNED